MKRLSFFALMIVAGLCVALIAWLRSPAKTPNTLPTGHVMAAAPSPNPPKAAATPTKSLMTTVPVQTPGATEDADAMTAKLRAMQTRGYHDMRLRVAEAKAKLTLNDQDHQRLLDEVEDYQHAEAMIDRPFVKVVSFDGEKLVLEIPPHAEQSATVKNAFIAQIHKDFSPELADRIAGAFDANFEVLFDGFGKFSRTYTVHKPREDGQVNVVTVAKIPEGADTTDRTMAREASDLSGDGWFSREILDMEHEVIVPTVEAYFPKDPAVPQPPRVP